MNKDRSSKSHRSLLVLQHALKALSWTRCKSGWWQPMGCNPIRLSQPSRPTTWVDCGLAARFRAALKSKDRARRRGTANSDRHRVCSFGPNPVEVSRGRSVNMCFSGYDGPTRAHYEIAALHLDRWTSAKCSRLSTCINRPASPLLSGGPETLRFWSPAELSGSTALPELSRSDYFVSSRPTLCLSILH